jgi:pyridinium-3,5-bisthiocarboxylic acid mononucleotide nickel chelatase
VGKNILYFDCFAGISGDMAVGAMLDIIDVNDFRTELQKLKLNDYEIKIETVLKNGITGTSFTVIDNYLKNEKNIETHSHSHENVQHIHSGENSHHEHAYHTKHKHSHGKSRNLEDISKIINDSNLETKVKALSLKIFGIIGEAEAKIHNKSLNEIHFHEVGAIDSIIDIVSFAICYDILKPEVVKASPINLGNGFVKCEHGTLPVPAPAVLEISKGIPVYKSEVNGELTTPTGIAILKAVVSEFNPVVKITPEKIGYGAGKRNYDFPNMLRVMEGKEE